MPHLFEQGVVTKETSCDYSADHLNVIANTINFANELSGIAQAQQHMEDYINAHNNYKFAMNALARLVISTTEFLDDMKAVQKTMNEPKRKKRKKGVSETATACNSGHDHGSGSDCHDFI